MYLDVEWDYVKSTDGKDYDNQICYDMGEAYDLVDELIEEGSVYHILVTLHETWGGVEVGSEEIYEWERNEDGSITEKEAVGKWQYRRWKFPLLTKNSYKFSYKS